MIYMADIALCRHPSTSHLDGEKRICTGKNGCGPGGRWVKNEGAKKVFQNHRYC